MFVSKIPLFSLLLLQYTPSFTFCLVSLPSFRFLTCPPAASITISSTILPSQYPPPSSPPLELHISYLVGFALLIHEKRERGKLFCSCVDPPKPRERGRLRSITEQLCVIVAGESSRRAPGGPAHRCVTRHLCRSEGAGGGARGREAVYPNFP